LKIQKAERKRKDEAARRPNLRKFCLHPSSFIPHPSFMSWPATSIHVLDFEGGRRSGIVEFGVVTLLNGQFTATHSRLCAPAGPVTAAESALHGITEADATRAAPFSIEQELFFALRQTGPFAAHHAPVERGMLRHTWPVPPASPDFAAANPATAPRVADWGPWLDTRRIYERLYPGLSNYQLGDLIKTFALVGELSALAATYCAPNRRRPHCALFDALAAALLLVHLMREPATAPAPLAWLMAQSVSPEEGADFLQSQIPLEE
jgi:DNA polymerase III epsilon subunit-like protein